MAAVWTVIRGLWALTPRAVKYAIALLAASLIGYGAGWMHRDHAFREYKAEQEKEAAIAEQRNRSLVAAERETSKRQAQDYKRKLSAIQKDHDQRIGRLVQRMRSETGSSVPAAPKAGPGDDGSPAGGLPGTLRSAGDAIAACRVEVAKLEACQRYVTDLQESRR